MVMERSRWRGGALGKGRRSLSGGDEEPQCRGGEDSA